MGVWKRLQRRGKNASKFEFTISYHDLTIQCSKAKWLPSKLSVNWTRRNRNIRTRVHELTSNLENCTLGRVDWQVPENVSSTITLYRQPREEEFEDKDWTFFVEAVDGGGRRKPIATCKMNMKDYASLSPCPRFVELNLKTNSHKFYEDIKLSFTISCSLIKEGLATDDDMVSLASLMSHDSASGLDTNDDVANMADFEGMGNHASSFSSFTAQMGSFLAMAENSAAAEVMSIKSGGSADRSEHIKMYIGTPPSTPPAQRKRDKSITPSNCVSSQAKRSSPPKEEGNRVVERGNSPAAVEERKKSLHAVTPTTVVMTASNASAELLSWAQDITSSYHGVKVTNFTTSWRNGMAFCAIIHHYRPELLDFEDLNPREIKINNKTAFDAAASLGVTRIMEPADMVVMKIPDKLQIKTYLHELRTHFTGRQLQLKAVGDSPSLSSYVFGHIDYEPKKSPVAETRGQSIHSILPTRSLSSDLTVEQVHDSDAMLVRDLKPAYSAHDNNAELEMENVLERLSSATSRSDTGSRSSCERLLEELRISEEREATKRPLMTRNELLNPFDSDEEEDDPYAHLVQPAAVVEGGTVNPPTTPPDSLSLPTSVAGHTTPPETAADSTLTSSSTEIYNDDTPGVNTQQSPIEVVSHSTDTTNTHQSSPSSHSPSVADKEQKSEQRRQELLARARKLMEKARQNNKRGPKRTQHLVERSVDSMSFRRERTPPAVPVAAPAISAHIEPQSSLLCQTDGNGQHCEIYDVNEYVYLELASLEREQDDLDVQAAGLEIKLRRAMNEGKTVQEDYLTEQWFLLVNKKNALIRRQEQLNILEKEEDLTRRYDLLNRELRQILSLQEWEKSPYQKQKEQALLDELVSVVDKRNALVLAIDQQQASLEQDEATEEELKENLNRSNNSSNVKDQCVIQ